jgi:hypothetical protein
VLQLQQTTRWPPRVVASSRSGDASLDFLRGVLCGACARSAGRFSSLRSLAGVLLAFRTLCIAVRGRPEPPPPALFCNACAAAAHPTQTEPAPPPGSGVTNSLKEAKAEFKRRYAEVRGRT